MTTEGEMWEPQGGDMITQLEDVLEAYAMAEPGPSRATLTEWIGWYPQFARELTEFTARWQMLEWVVDEDFAGAERQGVESASEEERLLLRGMSAAQSVFYRERSRRQAAQAPGAHRSVAEGLAPATAPSRSATPGEPPISGLIQEAKRSGLAIDTLAERAGLSDGLLRKIDRRLIDPASIPTQVLSELARALDRSLATVMAYVQLAPAFGAGAQHRASQAPTLLARREDFFDAVRHDLVLDDTRRRALLALARPSATDPRRDTAQE